MYNVSYIWQDQSTNINFGDCRTSRMPENEEELEQLRTAIKADWRSKGVLAMSVVFINIFRLGK